MKRLEGRIYAFRFLLQNKIIYKPNVLTLWSVFTYLTSFNVLGREGKWEGIEDKENTRKFRIERLIKFRGKDWKEGAWPAIKSLAGKIRILGCGLIKLLPAATWFTTSLYRDHVFQLPFSMRLKWKSKFLLIHDISNTHVHVSRITVRIVTSQTYIQSDHWCQLFHCWDRKSN